MNNIVMTVGDKDPTKWPQKSDYSELRKPEIREAFNDNKMSYKNIETNTGRIVINNAQAIAPDTTWLTLTTLTGQLIWINCVNPNTFSRVYDYSGILGYLKGEFSSGKKPPVLSLKAIVSLTYTPEIVHKLFQSVSDVIACEKSIINATEAAFKLSGPGDIILFSPSQWVGGFFVNTLDAQKIFDQAVQEVATLYYS